MTNAIVRRSAFVESVLRGVHPRVTDWRAPTAVRADCEAMVDLALARCADLAFAESFALACPVDGIRPESYLHRVVRCKRGQYLGGIRFRGLEKGFPFVDILATDWGGWGLEAVLDSVREEWEDFAPRRIRIFCAEDPGPPWHSDQLVYAARVRDIAASDSRVISVAAEEALELVNVSYASLPEVLRPLVRPSDLEELLSASRPENGLLLGLIGGDGLAGVFAVERAADFGVEGYCVLEEAVRPSHQGRGLARALQRGCAFLIAAEDPTAVLFGTIAFENAASRRAAEASGRLQIGGYYWRDIT